MQRIAHLLFLISTSAVVRGQPGSNGYVYGSGAASGVGNAQVNSQSQSTWSNGLPSTYSQSMNNAGGSGISISGQANSAVNVDPQQQDTSSQVVSGNSNANSNGNAATGSLNNLDHSNSDNSNGLTVIGNSQITGNGTGVSVSNNVNSNVNKYPITTTTPYSCDGVPIACPAFCSFSGCGCICPIYAEGAAAAPNTSSKGSSLVKVKRRCSESENAEIQFRVRVQCSDRRALIVQLRLGLGI
ncbi:homeobox protein 6-like [Paramacrobiotus metropolitanus]|uniref:homeobox protein 6-like n=1 Tax=Paramacrobiotus metropolitanus TaxID=2943436 RepID=UPI002445EFC9|nr:homeobox protein 6-like [Paramacrobiotus metropolitanus]